MKRNIYIFLCSFIQIHLNAILFSSASASFRQFHDCTFPEISSCLDDELASLDFAYFLRILPIKSFCNINIRGNTNSQDQANVLEYPRETCVGSAKM